MGKSCVIGVDLGGTNVRAQAFYLDGSKAGSRFENSSNAQKGLQSILSAVIKTIREAVEAAEAPVQCVGLAVPGHIDDPAGMVRWAPNLGEYQGDTFLSLRNVQLREPLESVLNIPIRMGNDANLAAMGEYSYGSGNGNANCLVMLTLGTGIGGGVILGAKSVLGDMKSPSLLVGGNAGGAELGHMLVYHGGLVANSGEYGALEGYCSRDAIIQRAKYRLLRGRKSCINDMIQGDYEQVTPKVLYDAAEAGDDVAIEVLTEVGEFLGAGIGSLINIFAPDVFAVGGQISKAGDYLLGPARRTAINVAIPSLWEDCQIVAAQQTDDAGILGAAALAWSNLE